jgi:lipopolysaccharide heptosyltransferase I
VTGEERRAESEPRLLIVRLSALGDIVHALPVLGALRQHWPTAHVDWLVEEAYAPILELASGLHRRVIVRARHDASIQVGAKKTAPPHSETVAFGGPLGYPRAVAFLRRQRYDVALDLQGLIKSAVWARLSGAARVMGFHRDHLRETQAAALYTDEIVPPPSAHVIKKNLALAHALGASEAPLDFPLQPNAAPPTREAITRAGGAGRYMVINPGAAWPNKRWPAERFGELAALLASRHGLGSIVTWGPAEHELAESVARSSAGAAHLAPPTSISDLAVLLRDAALVVSGDTGPLHIAAAMGAPVVGLYGPTWPERNGPWDPADEVISRAHVCVCHHKRRCLRGRPCIDDITVADVLAAAERRLTRSSVE